jgi:hypothetical protein
VEFSVGLGGGMHWAEAAIFFVTNNPRIRFKNALV